jgi:serine/threonine protein kinase
MSTANAVTSGLDCASPESIMEPNNLTPTGDQYSLGCVFYFLLTGRCPFPEGSAAEKMMAHQFKEPTPIAELSPDVPAELIAVVERLMQKSPDARYAATTELVAALRPLTGNIAPPPIALARPSPAPHSVSPSTTTPKPPAMGTLPSRNSVRGKQPASPPPAPEPAGTREVKAQPKPQAKPEPTGPRVIPGGDPAAQIPPPSLDDRLGPIGIAISALVACALVYAMAVWLQLF